MRPPPLVACSLTRATGSKPRARRSLEKLKARFRKMCLKWHPDKNRGREKEAAEVFQAVNAAYHFLTTNNFDYKRWQQSFTIPPMQSLDEVRMHSRPNLPHAISPESPACKLTRAICRASPTCSLPHITLFGACTASWSVRVMVCAAVRRCCCWL